MAVKKAGSSGLPVEMNRLDDDKKGNTIWKKWGPYLSERQWGTAGPEW